MANAAKNYVILALIGVVSLSGCALTPYEEDFACEGTEDYGRCVSVEGAYEQAVTGVPQGTKITRDHDEEDEGDGFYEDEFDDESLAAEKEEAGVDETSRYVSYRASVYSKLKRMVKEPVTPMVKQPEVVRTLVLNYQSEIEGTPLFMHRYVYFFGDKPKWVMGEYQQIRKELVMPVVEVE